MAIPVLGRFSIAVTPKEARDEKTKDFLSGRSERLLILLYKLVLYFKIYCNLKATLNLLRPRNKNLWSHVMCLWTSGEHHLGLLCSF